MSSRPVLASFPLCDIAEKDLTQNPQFCKLLATLSQHVDQTGLTVPLKTELDKVFAGTVLTQLPFTFASVQAHWFVIQAECIQLYQTTKWLLHFVKSSLVFYFFITK